MALNNQIAQMNAQLEKMSDRFEDLGQKPLKDKPAAKRGRPKKGTKVNDAA